MSDGKEKHTVVLIFILIPQIKCQDHTSDDSAGDFISEEPGHHDVI